jgi:hypothetical protein
VPVFVMLPLNTVKADGRLNNPEQLRSAFKVASSTRTPPPGHTPPCHTYNVSPLAARRWLEGLSSTLMLKHLSILSVWCAGAGVSGCAGGDGRCVVGSSGAEWAQAVRLGRV